MSSPNIADQRKELAIEQLKKTPIVQVVCEKIGLARATYYRWRNEDPDFRRQTDEALAEGSLLVNDMAESQLMSAIKDKNLTAIIFWLKHHHQTYATRVELHGSLDHQMQTLTPQQEQLINKALALATQLSATATIKEVEDESKPTSTES